MSDFQAHQQLVLRLYDELASRVREDMTGEGEYPPVELKRQEDMGPVFFQFFYRSEAHPALLMNMPCNLETHKTFDNITFFKSADIGQMLQVFANDADREEVYGQLKQIEGYNCSPSGLTPPTSNIIKRKYLKTRMHKERPHELVAEVEEEIENMKPAEDTIEIIEEVVDFEDWMVHQAQPDGITITLGDAEWGPDSAVLQHNPQMLFKRKEIYDMEAIMQKEAEDVLQEEAMETAQSEAVNGAGQSGPEEEEMVIADEEEVEVLEEGGGSDDDEGGEEDEQDGEDQDGDEQEEGGEADDSGDDQDEEEDADWMNQMEGELDL